jgi:hypothetical protein
VAGYAWSNPLLEGKGDPAKVFVELERIRKAVGANDGSLPTDAVVEFAKTNKRSELHKLFEWDDSVAAEAHRRATARMIIRSVRVVYSDHTPEPLRVYVRPAKADGYRPLEAVAKSDLGVTAAFKSQALNELLAWVARYEQIVSFLPGTKTAIDIVIAALKKDLGR